MRTDAGPSRKLATRLRVMPKISKKAFQNDCDSARSAVSFAHSVAKACERSRMSFQESGMAGV